MKRLLILGGTGEARELGRLIAARQDIWAMISLAGRTTAPLPQNLRVRTGGFGGATGLADYITHDKIDLLIDATHPFAAQMSRNAGRAAAITQTPLLHVRRPAWDAEPGENWVHVRDIPAAIAALPTGARVFAATGSGSFHAFAARPDIYTTLRVIDPPSVSFAGNGTFVVARPPFSKASETKALKDAQATHLIVKNAGGQAGRTKLAAAADLGLPIIMVSRVPLPDGARTVQDAKAAMEWVQDHI